MKKVSFRPSIFWSAYIDRFYVLEFKDNAGVGLPTVLPGTGLELLFHLDRPFSINKEVVASAHVFCPRAYVNIDVQSSIRYLAVRFKSGAFRHFCDVPTHYLINRMPCVEELWGNAGKIFMQKLQDAEALAHKLREVERFLTICFLNHNKSEPVHWDEIIHKLYKGYNEIDLQDLAFDSNLSYRQFERGFKEHFGTTAKRFQRIAKFQDTVKSLVMQKEKNYLSLALDNGYYDQSHFIKEFKSMTGSTPTAYLQEENFKQHYFYKSYTTQ